MVSVAGSSERTWSSPLVVKYTIPSAYQQPSPPSYAVTSGTCSRVGWFAPDGSGTSYQVTAPSGSVDATSRSPVERSG